MNKFQRVYNKTKRNLKRVKPKRLRELRQECEDKWLQNSDIIGIAQTDKGIVVYRDKAIKTESRLQGLSLSEDEFDAYTESPLDVVYTEMPQMFNWENSSTSEKYEFSVVPTKRIRPIYGGLSVGHKDVTAGTLSLVVRDKDTKESLILSNCHILANLNKGKRGDAIVS